MPGHNVADSGRRRRGHIGAVAANYPEIQPRIVGNILYTVIKILAEVRVGLETAGNREVEIERPVIASHIENQSCQLRTADAFGKIKIVLSGAGQIFDLYNTNFATIQFVQLIYKITGYIYPLASQLKGRVSDLIIIDNCHQRTSFLKD